MTATGYEPLNTLKSLTTGLWTVDGAPMPRAFVPVPTRSAVVKLKTGDLWVYALTEFSEALAEELAQLGPVAHIIVPNEDYEGRTQNWAAAYPKAELWDTERLRSDAAEDAWKGQLHQCVVRVRANRREAVFCHRPSRTLIFADLFEALETRYLVPWVRPIVWLSGTDDSGGHMRPSLRWGRRYDDKVALGRDIETLMEWGPRGIVPGHGRIFETHAVRQLERAFRKELRPLRWETAFQKKDG